MTGARILALAIVFGAALCACTPAAQASPQFSGRIGFGFGAALGDLDKEFLFEMLLRGEVLFGAPGDEHVRVGPALDLRTVDISTFEAALGATILLPIARGYPITLTAAAGYAFRADGLQSRGFPITNGPIAVATLTWGYRSYDFHNVYGAALQVFVSARVHLDDVSRFEITAGIEVDLEYLVLIPALFFRMLTKKGDPDE